MESLESPWPGTAGAVLAGGRSTRMGTDKAEIEISGETLLARAWRLVTSLVRPAWVCCSPIRPRPGYPCLVDAAEGEGPARGVAAALEAAQERGAGRVLVLACDLPRLTRKPLADLLDAPAPPDTLATVYAGAATGKAEMLVGVYAVAALPLLLAGLTRGERSLFRLIPPQRLQRLPYGPDAAPLFLNCNNKADLARLRGREEPGRKPGGAPFPKRKNPL
ncbi:MAG: molybdenum cofactor guanylyltransferase [Desulfovibrio sp.]|nr:molybdenum cofactor guanylyltransferase [Desulfovibrio sp.]